MIAESDATFIRHSPCDNCGSRDNNAVYSDGHEHCFGCGAHKAGDGSQTQYTTRRKALGLIGGEPKALLARKITEETCKHFSYHKATYKGAAVQVANYYDTDGNVVAQKLRKADKSFSWLGDPSKALPFGAHAFPKSGKMIVVTEGEIDALSMSQVQGNKWPVVSIGCGAGPQVRKYLGQHREYLLGFDKIVLMFDNDEPGREAVKAAASIIGSKAHIAELPLKDANEMLVAGRTEELVTAMWRAKQYRPEGIVDMADLKEAVKAPPVFGLSFPWKRLTELTYGIPERAVITIGGAGGGGKTDVLTQIMQHLTTVHHEPIGVFSLEQHIVETATRLAGKYAGRTFHVPNSGWTDDDKDAAWSALMGGGKVFLYDSFGVNEWDAVREKIEYLRHTFGVRYFFIDNLTALAAAKEDEKTGIERIMSEMGSMVQRLDVTLFVVSHLATPEGKPHEEGGRVMGKHFKGSRSIIFWSYLMLGLERNQQAEDPIERATTTVRVLKERKTGRGVGETTTLFYDRETGLLHERDLDIPELPSSGGDEFRDSGEAATSDF